jgi:hypothetical protein
MSREQYFSSIQENKTSIIYEKYIEMREGMGQPIQRLNEGSDGSTMG